MPEVEIATITPAQAKSLIENTEAAGILNRAIKHQQVRKNADEMLNGEWNPLISLVVLDSEGYVVNGFHRLLGCVMANKSFKTVLTTVPYKNRVDAMAKIDTGVSRSAADVLQMQGFKYAQYYAIGIRTYLRHQQGWYGDHNITVTNHEILTFAEENNKKLLKSLEDLHNTSLTFTSPSKFVFLQLYARSRAKSYEFSYQVTHACDTAGNMIHRTCAANSLREKLQAAHTANKTNQHIHKLNQYQQVYLMVKSYRLWLDDKPAGPRLLTLPKSHYKGEERTLSDMYKIPKGV